MSKKKKTNRRIARKVLFGVEILVLVLLVGVLFVYTQFNKKMDKVTFQSPAAERQEVEINENVSGSEVLSGYTNIALFGLDNRDEGTLEQGNSDAMMIASINNSTKEIRLVSLFRDAYMRIDEDSYGNGVYNKCNSAYAMGGPYKAVSMMNTNLDLDIQNFVSVDFNAMVTVIEELGGLEVDLSYEELVHMNNYCKETAKLTNRDYEPIEEPERPEDITAIIGTYHLDGVQATSYCRIRYTASMDMGRAERQRRILGLMIEKAKKSSLTTLNNIMDEVFSMILTDFSKAELIKLGSGLLSYKLVDNMGFPLDYVMGAENTEPVTGLDCLVPATLETNVKYLHQFLFENEDYEPSETVLKRSDFLVNKTGFGSDYVPEERKYLISDRETNSYDADYEDADIESRSYDIYDDYDNTDEYYGGYDANEY